MSSTEMAMSDLLVGRQQLMYVYTAGRGVYGIFVRVGLALHRSLCITIVSVFFRMSTAGEPVSTSTSSSKQKSFKQRRSFGKEIYSTRYIKYVSCLRIGYGMV